MMHLYCFFPLNVKGNTQHLSFLAFHGQAAKHETQRNNYTMMTKKTGQGNSFAGLSLGGYIYVLFRRLQYMNAKRLKVQEDFEHPGELRVSGGRGGGGGGGRGRGVEKSYMRVTKYDLITSMRTNNK